MKPAANSVIRKIFATTVVIAGIFSIIASGGPRYATKPSEKVISASNDVVDVLLTPACSGDCTGFLLFVKNKTNSDIEIDWNKTMFITRGTTSGGFMFEGIIYAQRSAPKNPDVVFSKGSFTKMIYPVNLVEYTSGKYGGWSHAGMPNGETGVYLVTKIGSQENKLKITTNLTTVQVQ